jgi:hypothetical protein
MKDPAALWLRLLLLGAASFWTPAVIVHGMAGRSFSGIHAILLTIVLPWCFACAYVMAKRRYRNAGTFIALPMLIGLWTLGGIFMNVAASFSGGGFAAFGGLREGLLNVLLSFLPPYTFMMATYDGTLFALLLATVAPLFARIVLKPKEIDVV